MASGSFLVFRKLEQNVTAWNKMLEDESKARNIPVSDPLTSPLAAKLMGRWQSGMFITVPIPMSASLMIVLGCPVMLSPDKDDTTKAFQNTFDFGGQSIKNTNDSICPLGSHIRKTDPRRDLKSNTFDKTARILRRGIPYGQEYTGPADTNSRGLLFACYQSNLDSGFRFIQRFWANSPSFPTSGAGIDLMMGQTASSANVPMNISDIAGKTTPIQVSGENPFVKCRGREYFFMPTLTALMNSLSKSAAKL